MSFASTRVRRQLREVAQLPEGAPVPSPCNNVCRIDAATGLCLGCLRTLDEVAAWGSMADEGKREVWQRLGARAGVEEKA
ncbi:DUF1289 domain-containing protein [Ramlibacter humi]|uniref:DUF1289 domain-containing protein n=1 Tax=Ramlibacter humi TaxID=2530451 RepID=A0A4Z0BL14_9BURK|nr:DUF1289 domain-containing protein [Ramlibacter humi]TFY99113.1 DUF1289 domain-containing protein [Ramlibacter humi]